VALLASIRRRFDRRLVCRAAVELMTDYLEGVLDPADRRRFEAHLERCGACAAYLAQMRATVQVLGRLEPAALPADVRNELIELYRRMQQR
jgi:anti-sigma factor RsiW